MFDLAQSTFLSRLSIQIDHAFINQVWTSWFPDAYADFVEPGQSDHAACIFKIPSLRRYSRKPFKFYHHIIDHPEYPTVVAEAWNPGSIMGSNQFKLVRSMKVMKKELKKINTTHFSGISMRVKDQSVKVEALQRELLTQPNAANAVEEHRERDKLNILLTAEQKCFRQRSRARWADVGDRNTPFFHKTVTQRNTRNHIHYLRDENDNFLGTTAEIKSHAAAYFKNILGETDLFESPSTVDSISSMQHRDGRSANFWYDYWTDIGPLIEAFGYRGPRELLISLEAAVVKATENGEWTLPPARSDEAETLQIVLSTMTPPDPSKGVDTFLWRNGEGHYVPKFSIKETWHSIRDIAPTVQWDSMTHPHLFFQCSFVSAVWAHLCGTSIAHPPSSLQAVEGILSSYQVVSSSGLQDVIKLLPQCIIYCVRRERNMRIFQQTSITEAGVIARIDRLMRDRLISIPP
ncbi:hypothetical protein Bca4012_094782 [Brassica carinata]